MARGSSDGVDRSAPAELTAFELDAPDDRWLARVRRASLSPDLGRLGDYELLEEINRGAQGVVYRARKAGESRIVAVKRLLAGGFATVTARARFERELEAVAALEHPNIVRAVGAGTSEHHPILVMEWVEGIPIDHWADRVRVANHNLFTLLDVFLVVCDAVHHAHQRGVVHRDLKPSNILIDSADRPHLLDFGLAKLQGDHRSSISTVTGTGDFLGTPAYAAPEQVRGEHGAVDVRTDVYALGVILFRMLTGGLPFDSGRGLADLLSDIQRAAPARPSRLNRALPDELDAIVAKAMARDADRRYASVDGLIADLRRFLGGEAVEAERGRRWYEMRKTVQRHRTAFAALLTILLIAVGAATALAMMYARQGRLLEQVTAARDAESRAHQSARRQQKVLEELLAAAAEIGKGADLEVRRAWLDEATRVVEVDLIDDPAARAAAHNSIGRTYQSLGLYTEAEQHLRNSLALRAANNSADDVEVAASLHRLGEVLQDSNRFAEAEPFLREALAMRRRLFTGDHPDVAASLESVGLIFQFRMDYETAEDLHQQALAMHRRLFGESDVRVAHDHDLLGTLRINQTRYGEAEAAFREALRIQIGALGEEHRDVAATKINLAKALFQQGDYGQAESLFRDSIAASRRLLGDRHDNVAWGLHRLGVLLHAASDYAEAESTLKESVAIYRACFGDHDPYVALVLNSLGTLQLDRGEFEDAKANFEESLAIRRERLPADDPRLVWYTNRLGEWYEAVDATDDAESILRASLGVRLVATDVESGFVVRTLDSLARILIKRESLSEAEVVLAEALSLRRANLGDDHPDVGRGLVNLGIVQCARGDFDAGRVKIKEGMLLQERKLGGEHPELARSLMALARCASGQGDEVGRRDAVEKADRICKMGECPPTSANSFWAPAE